MKKRWMAYVLGVMLVTSLTGCAEKTTQQQTENASIVQEDEAAATVGRTSSNEELAEKYKASVIVLNEKEITVDGKVISSDSSNAVYAANDIVFYLEGQGFTYGAGSEEDEHSQQEADAHTVVHITQPGNYVLSGSLSKGQIAVDLGEDAKEDESAVVTLIFNNAEISSSVAPGVIFYNVYECGDDNAENAVKDVDTSKAGANVIVADGSVNQVNGSYVARIYKSIELNEEGTEVVENKKLHKYDGAFYSKMSININGEEEGSGILNIHAENEGLDSELHLTINGGNIYIYSQDDGINTNEDGVSVTTINGGVLNIVVEGDKEGDGIDSNGWLVINGGSVTAAANKKSMDSGIDSDMGIHINGGSVAASGHMLDTIDESAQMYAVFSFASEVAGGTTITLKNEAGEVVSEYTPVNAFTYLVISEETFTEGTYTIEVDGIEASVGELQHVMQGMPPMPQAEEGKQPEGIMPERPQGEEGKQPDGAMPKKPQGEGSEPPNGEMPPMPQGTMGGMDLEEMELATQFTIDREHTMFLVVTTEK